MTMETKQFGGNVIEVKQVERNGVPVGIVAGYIATWDIDRGADKFERGAFAEDIERHRMDNRPVRLKDHHGRTVGGFPIATVREDERGLYGEGEINLEVQQGREAYSLAKQGVLSDFSIGYSVSDYREENGVRVITKAMLWEGSVVDEPMNQAANIVQVKAMTADEVKEWTVRDIEKFLHESGLSKTASKALSSRFDKAPEPQYTQTDEWSLVLNEIKGLKL